MHPVSPFIDNPVKVSVGVLLLVMFGMIALWQMPMQLSPDVERPIISVSTNWPGRSPQEIEQEIVNEQEEQLKSVSGIVKMSSECSDSSGEIDLEFEVGTNMNEAVLRVNSQLQQIREYPENADRPRIRMSSNSDRSIAWFILSAKPPSEKAVAQFRKEHPELNDELDRVLRAQSTGLETLRLSEFAAAHPEAQSLVPDELDVPKLRKFTEDVIESSLERVSGVSDAQVRGGQQRQLKVIVDPSKLATRGLTLIDVRDALRGDNQDTSAGDLWEGKRRYIVRTLGQFRSLEEVANQIVATQNGQPIYLHEVADVEMGHAKPTGFVRRFGVENLAISVSRESGSNVFNVMEGLREQVERLNNDVLDQKGLVLSQVYDETKYIDSAISLVNQNIFIGSALTVIILMLFLHIGGRSLIWIPMLAGSAIAAVLISPWFFLLTLALIIIAGLWFARGALVVALAIPTSVVGTFLILNLMGRTLNVISLAGLAFAVGMLVDNAVVVLENIYRYHQKGAGPFEAARQGVIEVWGAVLASTLTTLAVFLPVIFLQGEAGQLFADIALAISAAVGLSLLVSVLVIPTASARLVSARAFKRDENYKVTPIQKFIQRLGGLVTGTVVGANRKVQATVTGRIALVLVLIGTALGVSWLLMPELEYLPGGNRNLVICNISPPPGYNPQELGEIGQSVEARLKPYWDKDLEELSELPADFPAIGDFFYVARSRSVFLGLRAHNPANARKLIELIQTELKDKYPGSFVSAFQTSLFGRGLSGSRNIDIEITGPELENLVDIGGQIMRGVTANFPEDTQARPEPSLDLSSPELHVRARPEQAREMGMSNSDLGFVVNTLIDGANIGDYFIGGEKIDLVLMGDREYVGQTQDIGANFIATQGEPLPVRLDAVASVKWGAGPEQIHHRERERAITIGVSPPDNMSLEAAIDKINGEVIEPLRESGAITSQYKIHLSGTADKLAQTWLTLRWSFLLAILITYLLMAALFESWTYPFVIILSVPMGAVGGIIGLQLLGLYLAAQGIPKQSLDVLTMLGFIILIGTVVNNAILIVHQSLIFMRENNESARDAVLKAIQARIRPIFMTTLTTVFGLSPLVFFPGAGSELYRGLGSVVLGGLIVATLVTLFLVPTMFTLMVDLQNALKRLFTSSQPTVAVATASSATASSATASSATASDAAASNSESTPEPIVAPSTNGTQAGSTNGSKKRRKKQSKKPVD